MLTSLLKHLYYILLNRLHWDRRYDSPLQLLDVKMYLILVSSLDRRSCSLPFGKSWAVLSRVVRKRPLSTQALHVEVEIYENEDVKP